MNEMQKALERIKERCDKALAWPRGHKCDYLDAVMSCRDRAGAALAALPPADKGDGSVEHPFIEQYVGKCFHRKDHNGIEFDVGICERDDGYELTITGPSGVDEWYAIHPDGKIVNLGLPPAESEGHIGGSIDWMRLQRDNAIKAFDDLISAIDKLPNFIRELPGFEEVERLYLSALDEDSDPSPLPSQSEDSAPEGKREERFPLCRGCKRDGLQRRVSLCQDCRRLIKRDYYEPERSTTP